MKKLGAFRTTEELEGNPYPKNVQTVCAYWVETDETYDTGYEDLTVAEDNSEDNDNHDDKNNPIEKEVENISIHEELQSVDKHHDSSEENINV